MNVDDASSFVAAERPQRAKTFRITPMTKFLIYTLLSLATLSSRAETLTVNVTTEGPREGVIAILVFNSKKGFPNKPEKALLKARFPVTAEGTVECVITNLPHGTYSLSVLHDINDNSRCSASARPKNPLASPRSTASYARNPATKRPSSPSAPRPTPSR